MRRLLLLAICLVIPLLAAGSPFTVTASSGHPYSSPTHEHKSKKACPKPKKGKHVTIPKRCKKIKGSRPATPTPTRTRRATPTKVPIQTPTSTATATSTPTQTPTPTATLPPAPSLLSLGVSANANPGYRIAFYVCGLPAGVTATFSPSPAIATDAPASPYGATAGAALAMSVSSSVAPGSYALALRADVEDPAGQRVNWSPGGDDLQPHAVLLTVDGGHASASGSSAEVAVGSEGCSAVPAGFAPPPAGPPAAGSVTVSAYVPTQHAAANSLVSIYGSILVNGQPVSGIPMHTRWYMPNSIQTCDGITDGTGSATCSVVNDHPLPNNRVPIQVSFVYAGQTYATSAVYVQ